MVVFKNKFDYYRKQILSAKVLMVEGKLQKESEVIHIIAEQLYDFSMLLNRMNIATNKQKNNTKAASKKAIQGSIFPEGRKFK